MVACADYSIDMPCVRESVLPLVLGEGGCVGMRTALTQGEQLNSNYLTRSSSQVAADVRCSPNVSEAGVAA